MSRTVRIQPGQIWISRATSTRTRSRRVLAVADGRVCYSTGGERPRWCQPRAFRLWIRRYKAKATRARRARTMKLRKAGAP